MHAHLLEQLDRLREWTQTLDRPIRDIDRRATVARHGLRIGTVRNEIQNHFVVAACSGMMQRRVTVVVALIHIGVQRFNDVLHDRHPAIRRVTV